MKRTRVRNLLLFIVFAMMLFSQPTQLLSQMDISQSNESTISSASYTSDVSVSHLTSPTTIPSYHEWKADMTFFPQAEKIVSLFPPVFSQIHFILAIVETTGFLGASKYQSNYLP